MLRSRVLAWACLAVLSVGSAKGQALKADPAPAPGPTSEAAKAEAPKLPEQNASTGTGEAPAPANSEAAKPAPPPEPTLTAAIDLGRQTIVVSENGSAKYTWPISSGTSEHPTPRGTFRPEWTSKMWYSRKYDNAPMPNAVFISGGVAIHATYHTGALGTPASHGCIRLAPGNAKTFYGLVQRHGLKLTKVSIYGVPKWGRGPAIASRDENRPRRYASRESDNNWFWGGSSYKTTSAYDPEFTRKAYRAPARQYYYANVPPPPPRAYRRYDRQRLVYVQRPPRRVYYYNNSGYGYGGGW